MKKTKKGINELLKSISSNDKKIENISQKKNNIEIQRQGFLRLAEVGLGSYRKRDFKSFIETLNDYNDDPDT